MPAEGGKLCRERPFSTAGRRWAVVVLSSAGLVLGLAQGALAEAPLLTEEALRRNTNGALGILGLSVVPNETVSTISVNSASGGTDFWASQLGGAFTVSDAVPLYLEGFLGFARYDPTFVFSDGGEQAEISPKWTSFAGTVGVGWDFPLTDELVLRPIVNFSLGHIESDASLAGRAVEGQTGVALRFLEDGRLNAYGYGGSLMLDWEHYRKAYEIDIELRYSHIHLKSFANSSDIAEGEADAITLGLWSRLRVPTGWEVFGGPLRGVGEFAFGAFIGDQAEVLDSPVLGKLGAGIEFDTTAVSWLPIARTRLMGRYVFGRSINGFSLGIGLSF